MDDKKKTKEQLIAELEELRERNAEIETAGAERKRAEEERIKELNCLYGISKLVEKPGITFDEIIQGAVDLISADASVF